MIDLAQQIARAGDRLACAEALRRADRLRANAAIDASMRRFWSSREDKRAD